MSHTTHVPPGWQRYADQAYQQGRAEVHAQYQGAAQYAHAPVQATQPPPMPHPMPHQAMPPPAPAAEAPPKTFAFEGINANVMTVISMVGFVAWVTYLGTTQLQSLQVGQERTEDKIDRTASEIKGLVSNYTASTTDRFKRLEDELKARSLSRFSRSDMEVWCAKTERLNADIKWRCGPIITQLSGHTPPIWENAIPAWATATTEPPAAGTTP